MGTAKSDGGAATNAGRMADELAVQPVPDRPDPARVCHDASRRVRRPCVIRRVQQRRAKAARTSRTIARKAIWSAACLGLLALLLAFSFSMALDRYEERRHLVIAGSQCDRDRLSAVRNCSTSRIARRLSKLLIAYTDNRITLGTGSHAGPERQLAINDRLLTEIWAAVTAARELRQRAWHLRPPSSSRSTR